MCQALFKALGIPQEAKQRKIPALCEANMIVVLKSQQDKGDWKRGVGGGGGENGWVRPGLLVKVRFEGSEGVGHADDQGQWSSTWGSCAPQGNLATSGRCYWYLVGRGQGLCYTSHNAQNSPCDKELSGLKC